MLITAMMAVIKISQVPQITGKYYYACTTLARWGGLLAIKSIPGLRQLMLPNVPLIYRSSRLSTQKSEDWTTGWDTWGQDSNSTEGISKNKKVSSKSKSSSKGHKKDEQKDQLIDFGNESGEKSKKSALSDAWDNDGWETLNKDD